MLQAPALTDPEHLATSHLLMLVMASSYFVSLDLYTFAIARQLNFSLQHGFAGSSATAYAAYSLILHAFLDRFEESYDFGRLAIGLEERFDAREYKCQVLFLFAHALIFYKPLRLSLSYLSQAIQVGLESGDLPFVSYSVWHHLNHRLNMGDPLSAVDEEADGFLALMHRNKNPLTPSVLRIYPADERKSPGSNSKSVHLER